MNNAFDALEREDPQVRESRLFHRLPSLIETAKKSPAWAKILEGVGPSDVKDRTALAELPITTKLDLKTLQKAYPPLGGIYVTPITEAQRVFMSPGPIFEAQGRTYDWWRLARPLRALGLQPGHLVQNCFSYHLTPGAFLIDEGARSMGCVVIPAGPGQIEQQINAMEALGVNAYTGTPSFLKMILSSASEHGRDVSHMKKALVSAEPLPPSLRRWLQEHGVDRVLQFYGTADVGAIAYETADEDHTVHPGMILNEDLLLEIVDPATGRPAAEGQIGEIVLTSFNPEYPLIRFGTGDLTAILPGVSPCGRTNQRITGWQGRVDGLIKVRGMFVHPPDVRAVMQRHAFIQQVQLVVDDSSGTDKVTLHCAVADPAAVSASTSDAVANTFRELTRVRAEPQFVPSLPEDAALVHDRRSRE